ncbi:MAG: 3-deoxy-manno-octulosonate cytidylyltransferase [Bacteroidales bacterium]|nr:3-deoxy-manno-octulosonate cytidylyltransferase [Bacteroidales bacterium]
MKIAGIIPARYNSTRFPGKPLAEIRGKPMILHTLENVKSSNILNQVLVATDDERIQKVVENSGGKCVLTSHNLNSGTERCAAALELMNESFDAIINIQGDEPFIHHDHIKSVAGLLEKNADIASLAKIIDRNKDIDNPDIVKVIINEKKEALYFSRFGIPYLRKTLDKDSKKTIHYKHIGIYGYRTDVLNKLVQLPVSWLEQAESLEQLRWLDYGYRIIVDITDKETIGIDSPEDLKDL